MCIRDRNVHEQLFPAIAGTQEVVDPQAIGVVEFYSIASAIKAADAAAKAAQVTPVSYTHLEPVLKKMEKKRGRCIFRQRSFANFCMKPGKWKGAM